MKRTFPYLCSIFIFIASLEVILNIYFFWNEDELAGSLVHTPSSSMSYWRGLPFKIPVSHGNLKRLTKGDKVIFDLPFQINADSTRAGFVKKNTENFHALHFLGCSFTFGTGVKDDETLPSYLAKKINRSSNI